MKKANRRDGGLVAMLEFTSNGHLKTVYLCGNSDQAQRVLEGGIRRLIEPRHWGWLSRIFRRSWEGE